MEQLKFIGKRLAVMGRMHEAENFIIRGSLAGRNLAFFAVMKKQYKVIC